MLELVPDEICRASRSEGAAADDGSSEEVVIAAVDAQRVQIHVATGVTWKGLSGPGVEQRLESQFEFWGSSVVLNRLRHGLLRSVLTTGAIWPVTMPQPEGRRGAGGTPQECSIHIRTPSGGTCAALRRIGPEPRATGYPESFKLAPGVFDDFGRVFDHTPKFGDPAAATQRIDEIIKAVDVLTHSPLLGRKVKGAKRELVIGRASRGYVALCRFLPDIDTVFALALRSQRERPTGMQKGRRCRVQLDAQPRRPASSPPGSASLARVPVDTPHSANIPHNAVQSGLDDCLYLPSGFMRLSSSSSTLSLTFSPLIAPSSSPIKIFCACCIFLASFFGSSLKSFFSILARNCSTAFRKAALALSSSSSLASHSSR